MSHIRDMHGYSMCSLVTFLIFLVPISIMLNMAMGTSSHLPALYFRQFSARAKSEFPGGSESHGGAVPLIPLNSGNGELDHQVNQFFKCIKKTGHTGGANGEPSRGEVDTCYNAVFVSGDS